MCGTIWYACSATNGGYGILGYYLDIADTYRYILRKRITRDCGIVEIFPIVVNFTEVKLSDFLKYQQNVRL